jgi:hypothetical protein
VTLHLTRKMFDLLNVLQQPIKSDKLYGTADIECDVEHDDGNECLGMVMDGGKAVYAVEFMVVRTKQGMKAK